MNPSTNRAGFTLVELLIAITVLAIVAVLGWRGLDGIARSRVKLGEQMEQTRGLQLAFAQLQSDCDHLADTELLLQRPNLNADPNRLTMVRTVFAENEPTRLQVVSYRLREGVLTRRESPTTRDLVQLDNLWQAALGDTDTSVAVQLQAGVGSMTVRMWNGGGWSSKPKQQQAQSNPPQPQPVLTPTQGLEVALQLEGQQANLVKVFLLGGV